MFRTQIRGLILTLLFLGAGGALLRFGARYVGAGTLSAQTQASRFVRSYVLERWLIVYGRSMGGSVVKKESVGRRSDGTICVKLLFPLTGDPVRTVLLPEGRRIHINDGRRIRSTTWLTPAEIERLTGRWERDERRSLQGQCYRAFEFAAGHVQVLGFDTAVRQREALRNGMLSRTTYYRAPELGCTILREVREERQAGGSFREQWEQVVKVVRRGEPPPEDLNTGDGYREASSAEFLRLSGLPADPASVAAFERGIKQE